MSDDNLPENRFSQQFDPSKKHPEKALSAVMVRSISKPGWYADGNCLYLVIDNDMIKKWVLRVTIHGRRRDLGLGGAKLVSLAEAREKAAALRKIARAGGDPIAERRREKQLQDIPTFEELAREVHRTLAGGFRNDKHAAQWISSLDTYVFPKIGARRVDQVEAADVLQVLLPIWTRIPETARRVRQRIKAVLQRAKIAGHRVGENPVEGLTIKDSVLPKHNTKQEHHAALPWAELPAFIQKLRTIDSCSPSIKLALEFLILTAARTSEVLFAKWTEVDIEAQLWTVPADRMKAKAEHIVPLSARCLELLEAAKAIADGGEYIFPGRSRRRPLSNMSFDMVLRRHMREASITVHGFRSSFRDWAEERTAFRTSVIEASLAHTVRDKVEAAYLRTKLVEKRRELLQVWADFATTPAAKVVRFRG